jgi:hypothetical protein
MQASLNCSKKSFISLHIWCRTSLFAVICRTLVRFLFCMFSTLWYISCHSFFIKVIRCVLQNLCLVLRQVEPSREWLYWTKHSYNSQDHFPGDECGWSIKLENKSYTSQLMREALFWPFRFSAKVKLDLQSPCLYGVVLNQASIGTTSPLLYLPFALGCQVVLQQTLICCSSYM